MKKLFTLFAMLTLAVSVMAQTINYQAVLRDTTDGKNELVRSQSGNVSIFVNAYNPIVEATADVPNSYPVPLILESEFTTNANGMVNVLIDLSEIEPDGIIDWKDNIITAVFAYGDGNKDTITLETPVTAVPYAVQAKDGNLTTGVITSYINNTSSSEQSDFNLVWNALMNNANLHKAVRDSIVEYLKDNYKYAKEILYSYMSQVTPEDVNEAYAQVQGLDQDVKDAVDTVLKHYLQKNHDLLIEVLEYYAQTATEDEMRTLYNDLKANGPAATKIKELMNDYFGRYLAYKGLVCDTTQKTLCDVIAAMNQGGGSNQGGNNQSTTDACEIFGDVEGCTGDNVYKFKVSFNLSDAVDANFAATYVANSLEPQNLSVSVNHDTKTCYVVISNDNTYQSATVTVTFYYGADCSVSRTFVTSQELQQLCGEQW